MHKTILHSTAANAHDQMKYQSATKIETYLISWRFEENKEFFPSDFDHSLITFYGIRIQ